MAKRKVTSKDVAKAAGVSQTTVSFVLNSVDDANISSATQQRVWRAARKLGYVPNVAAKSLAQGRSNNIGFALVHPHKQIFMDAYVPNILTGLGEIIQSNGFRLIVERIDDIAQYETVLNLLRGEEVAGMVVLAPLSDEEFLQSIYEHDIPVVSIGNMPVDVPYSVESDNLSGVHQIINHLIDLGHRRIACISYTPENIIDHSTDRLHVFKQTLLERGISPPDELIRFGSFEPQTGYLAMQELLEIDPPPTAVWGMNDMMALGAMRAIYEAGLHIPEDIAVAGFDDDRFAAFTHPPLTTIHEFQQELGVKAGEMLVDLIHDKEPEIANQRIPTELVIRQSCGFQAQQESRMGY